ncbi:hypothetical protein N9W17_04895 [Jannaschia sp.]|nr:hypothetical protein [Jannaschia sp.]
MPENICHGEQVEDLDIEDARPRYPVVERFDAFDEPGGATAYLSPNILGQGIGGLRIRDWDATVLERSGSIASFLRFREENRRFYPSREALGVSYAFWRSPRPAIVRLVGPGQVPDPAFDCGMGNRYVAHPLSVIQSPYDAVLKGAVLDPPGYPRPDTRYLPDWRSVMPLIWQGERYAPDSTARGTISIDFDRRESKGPGPLGLPDGSEIDLGAGRTVFDCLHGDHLWLLGHEL